MFEFAGLLAAISMFSASLSGLQAHVLSRVFVSDASAVQQVVVRARAQRVPPASARAAYARAPYKRPGLRYVYATAWVAGTKDQKGCVLAQLDVEGTRVAAGKALRADAGAMRQLRRLHLTATQAATAFARGFTSAC
jgi:hypothetical protein